MRYSSAWLDRDKPAPVRLTLAATLYTGANPDRTRKLCENCMFWLGAERAECFLHDAAVTTTAEHVCGYHIFGAPQPELRRENAAPLDPTTSGLDLVPGGTSCGNCSSFQIGKGEQYGTCRALYDADTLDDDGDPAHPLVDAMGCCGAWSAADSPA